MLHWLIATASLAGVILNIRCHVACFWIWTVTNATWAIADYRHGLPQQATLQSVYFLLSLYGIWKWSRPRGQTGPDPSTAPTESAS